MIKGINQYQQIGNNSEVLDADPHRVIQLLMQGVLDRIATAKGAMQRNEMLNKAMYIDKALKIIGGLRSSLNIEAGYDVAADLEQLYDYMERRLLKASVDNNVNMLDEVASLMATVKSGWDQIPMETRNEFAVKQRQIQEIEG